MMRLAVFLVAVGCVPASEIKASGEKNAAGWCRDMALDCTGVSCSGSDSDADGYTSCTAVVADGTRVPLECGRTVAITLVGQNTGCKEVRPINLHQPDAP